MTKSGLLTVIQTLPLFSVSKHTHTGVVYILPGAPAATFKVLYLLGGFAQNGVYSLAHPPSRQARHATFSQRHNNSVSCQCYAHVRMIRMFKVRSDNFFPPFFRRTGTKI